MLRYEPEPGKVKVLSPSCQEQGLQYKPDLGFSLVRMALDKSLHLSGPQFPLLLNGLMWGLNEVMHIKPLTYSSLHVIIIQQVSTAVIIKSNLEKRS